MTTRVGMVRSVGAVWRSVWRPGVVVAFVHVTVLLWYAWHYNYAPIDFVHVGTIFDESDPEGGWGYDGQFYYYIARDPWSAAQYLDNPTYRLRRIVYPLVSRAVALGNVSAIPLAMLVVNVVSVSAAAELLGRLLARAGASRWYALGYGVAFGQLASVTHQLGDPLGSAFIVVGLWAMGTRRYAWGAAAFGLAALTRDSLALVPLGYLAGFTLFRQWRQVLLIVVLGLAPLIVWTGVLEYVFRHSYDAGVTWTQIAEPIPLQGTLRMLRATPSFAVTLLVFLIPSWIVGIVAIRHAWQGWQARRVGPSPAWWGWVAPAALLVMLAAEQVIDFLVPARLAIGVSTTTAGYVAFAQSAAARRLSAYFASTGALYPPMVFMQASSVIP